MEHVVRARYPLQDTQVTGIHEGLDAFIAIMADQTLDGQGWKELVDQMAGNGAQGSDADFAQIATYLTKAFPPK